MTKSHVEALHRRSEGLASLRMSNLPTRSGFVRPLKQLARRAITGVHRYLFFDCGPSWAEFYTLNSLYIRLRDLEGGHPYLWGAMQGLRLAKILGQDRVSLIEFGVAGGNSLVWLERIAAQLERHFEVNIDVYGFDTGTGLPKPHDVRDMPNLWDEGAFVMNESKLRARLQRAHLFLGPVETTIATFLASRPAPIAFVAFDLDFYSSTTHALQLFEGDVTRLLPRIHCYFDDVLGYTFGDHVGERLAISDFNEKNGQRKISLIHGLRHYMPKRFAKEVTWEKYYMLHNFDHPLYGAPDGMIDRRTAKGLHALQP